MKSLKKSEKFEASKLKKSPFAKVKGGTTNTYSLDDHCEDSGPTKRW